VSDSLTILSDPEEIGPVNEDKAVIELPAPLSELDISKLLNGQADS